MPHEHEIEAVRRMMANAAPASQTSDAPDIGAQHMQALRSAMGKLSAARRKFLGDYQAEDMGEIEKLQKALRSGRYTRPSEYADTLGWLFGRLIPEAFRAEALLACDRCLTQPYSTSWSRRALRSADMSAYTDRIRQTLAAFAQDVLLPYDLSGLLTGHYPPEVAKYLSGQSWNHRHAALPCRIATAIDRGDEAVTNVVRAILLGQHQTTLMREVILGVVQSGNGEMHALLGQLLLAARLQEGLRQAICESADMGTPAAFLAILSTIEENDLIRFSAVKRAAGTWLGLISDDSGDLERISGKTITLIRRCLTDEAFREACLTGEDSMAIHVALWSIGFRDVEAAIRRAADIALHGSHHQRLTCGYFLTALNQPEAASRLARQVIPAFPQEMDTLAMYLPRLCEGVSGHFWACNHRNGSRPAVTRYFADETEARRIVDTLLSLRQGLKKTQTFDPCVFPWFSAKLDKALVCEKMMWIAALIDDDALTDRLLPYLADASVDDRHFLLHTLCKDPATPERRRTLLTALCDKGSYVRTTAAKLVQDLTLQPGDVPLLEDMLRYKYAEARPVMTGMLLTQGDDDLLASVTRLLGDKVEERRIAALDMVRSVVKSGKRPSLAERFRPLLTTLDSPTTKEQPLLAAIREMMGGTESEASSRDPLLSGEPYKPQPIDPAMISEALQCWARYFPDSKLPEELAGNRPGLFRRLFAAKGDIACRDQAQADIASLTRLVIEHAGDTVRNSIGEEVLLSSLHDLYAPSQEGELHLWPVWQEWFDTALEGDAARLMRACVLINTRAKNWAEIIQRVFGTGFHEETLHKQPTHTSWQVLTLLLRLAQKLVPAADRHLLGLALLCWAAQVLPVERLWEVVTTGHHGHMSVTMHFRSQPIFGLVFSGLTMADAATFPALLSAVMLLQERSAASLTKLQQTHPDISPSPWVMGNIHHITSTVLTHPSIPLLLRGAHLGLLPRHAIYGALMNGTVDRRQGMKHLSLLSTYHRLQGARPAADRWGRFERDRRDLQTMYLGHPEVQGEADAARLAFADEVCQPLLERIIDAEIRRGDAPSDFTPIAAGIMRLDGAENFIRILAALGKDKLVRTSSAYSTYASRSTRAESLCGLLRVCVPATGDTAAMLRDRLRQYGVKPARLIEAALYVPCWIELCEEALEMPGFTSAAYYFIAHMNEEFDDARMARIARFTPLTADELQNGAFDITWFRSAYGALGEERFNLFYDAAKYITDGAKHARARKYADAALGRLDPAAVQAEIAEKRNKDLLRAYALIPLADEADVQARYLYIQQFLKESRQFGAQRAASEKAAVAIALQNLAMNAGYADSMRLTLRMETRLTEENADLFTPHEIDGVTLQLTVDDQGLAAIECKKAGKALKSVPAKLKKDAHVLRLTEMKKQLTEQHHRARRMLEEAMETSAAFTAGEIAALMANPVIAPMLARLVFKAGDRFGFTDGTALTAVDGSVTALNAADELIIAHPYHLWQAKQWLPFQQRLFDGRIVQPIRQVFRELYIKTPEDLPRTTSLRYAGHQVQPQRTLACLKTRRWIADPEAGLQKVYYQENIIATIWALADWFSPADIEAPTIEHVAFLDRRTGHPLPIAQVPPVLFSEVMRDVDLAVSVAHAGDIDPECSHSTIEMRAALLTFTLPLFHLTNVTLDGPHALIDGTLAKYSVHLGSGIVHQRGGTMLSVLPVHSQHRGRLFLPFADDDPRTAEVLSKVLLFAEDHKIRDPGILEQIIR